MNKRLTVNLLLFCLLFFPAICFAQASTDSVKTRAVITNTIANFNRAIGPQSLLYNGADYTQPNRIIKGNPFFMDTLVTVKGTVNYYGFTYTAVPLQYSLYDDLLVSLNYDGFTRYSLTSNRVTDFDLLGHHFIHLDPDSIARRVIKPGFYDDMYTNKLQVLVKRTKNIHVISSSNTIEDRYEPTTYYYLKKGGKYYEVSGQGDFLDLLKDRKKELKKYLKDNHIKFRKMPEQAMVLLAAYYDRLTN